MVLFQILLDDAEPQDAGSAALLTIVRGAYCDGPCRDVIDWSCSRTVAKRCIGGL